MSVIVTVTGGSGSGKSTLVRKLVETGDFAEIVSTTTRQPRVGEVNGQHYHFVTPEEFEKTELLEKIAYNGCLYGASVEEFDNAFKSGKTPIIVVDPSGMAQINRFLKNTDKKTNGVPWTAMNVFVNCPPHIQYQRLLDRMLNDYRKIIAMGDTISYSNFMKEYVGRFTQVGGTEREWLDIFIDQCTDLFMHLPVFDRDNEQMAMDELNRLLSKEKQAKEEYYNGN
jgi:guanylate kinase